MKNVEFNYEGTQITIQCNENDLIKDICKKFASKLSLEMDSLFFIYEGGQINLESANTLDKKADKISINVYQNDPEDSSKNVFEIKDVICPECKENARLKIINYKITLFECKNNHKINNILLNEFNNTQIINLSNIKCDICKENDKGQAYKNKFYNCISCNKKF